MPENVRNAVDIANMKKKHSEFWYKLSNMSDKVYVYNQLFNHKRPLFEKAFHQRKQEQKEKERQSRKQSRIYNLHLKNDISNHSQSFFT